MCAASRAVPSFEADKAVEPKSRVTIAWTGINWEAFMRILSTGFALLVLNMAGAACVQAEVRQMPWEKAPPPHLIEDKLRLDISLWNVGINTVVRADATATQPGTTLDGESDVGLADGKLTPDIELTLFPGKRHIARINGFSSRRSGSAVLTRTVSFDGNNYTIGQSVRSTLNMDMLGVGYAYRLFKAPRYELDLGLDVQITSIETSLEAVPPTTTPESIDGVLPIPMLDMEGRWEVLPKWQLQARYRWLGVNRSDVKANLSDWRAGVQWQFSQHLAVGLHYRSFSIAVDSATNSDPGSLHLDFKGAQLGVRASF